MSLLDALLIGVVMGVVSGVVRGLIDVWFCGAREGGGMNYIDQLADQINDICDDEPLSDEWRPLFRIYALLALAKGEGTTLEDVHDAWCAWQAGVRPDHWYLVPFAELTAEAQRGDVPYRDAIHRVARALGKGAA